MRAGEATIYNLTVKFGKENLADYWEEYVLPAFFSGIKRKFGSTRYVFVEVGQGVLSVNDQKFKTVYGQFVRDTVLKAEQVLVDGELIERDASMPSAPSSTFVVILNPHRLIFMSDTSYAPTAKQFASTLESFIKKIRSKEVLRRYNELVNNNPDGKRVSKASIEREIPKPDVRVEAIPSDETIIEFVQSFEKVQLLKFKILPSNDEINPVDTFQGLTESSEEIGAPANLSFQDNQGLDKEAAIEVLDGAVKQGVNTIIAKGLDQDGDKVQKSNDDMKVIRKLFVIQHDVSERAQSLMRLFRDNF
jgi:hypothetical protein